MEVSVAIGKEQVYAHPPKGLMQVKSKGESDGSTVFQLMDQNVTKGQMKNLVTDKPAPITVELMQKQRAAMLAQQSKKNDKSAVFALSQAEKKGVPVLVNPVIMKNTEAETDLGLKMLVGPDEVSVAKKNAAKANAKKVATFAEIESSDEESEEE